MQIFVLGINGEIKKMKLINNLHFWHNTLILSTNNALETMHNMTLLKCMILIKISNFSVHTMCKLPV